MNWYELIWYNHVWYVSRIQVPNKNSGFFLFISSDHRMFLPGHCRSDSPQHRSSSAGRVPPNHLGGTACGQRFLNKFGSGRKALSTSKMSNHPIKTTVFGLGPYLATCISGCFFMFFPHQWMSFKGFHFFGYRNHTAKPGPWSTSCHVADQSPGQQFALLPAPAHELCVHQLPHAPEPDQGGAPQIRARRLKKFGKRWLFEPISVSY